MGRRRIVINKDLCVGCHSCELACILSHSEAENHVELFLSGERPVSRVHVKVKKGKATAELCRQCVKPACAEVCPSGACKRDDPSEPVLVDEDLCDGDELCVEACPFNMMFMNAEGTLAVKCDLCQHRLDKGMLPACVEACHTYALSYDDGTETRSGKDKNAVGTGETK